LFKNIHPFFVVSMFVLLGLLSVVVLNDVYRSINRNQPLSYDVVVLIKMTMCAVLGATAGYIAKK
jgi:uncharacterized membrane protein